MKPKSYSLLEAYEFLRKFHLSDSLHLIGAVNSALKYGVMHLEAIPTLPEEVPIWLGRATHEGTRHNISISITRLARFLLLSGANDHRGKPLSLLDHSLPTAMDIAGFLHDKELEDSLNRGARNITNNILGRVGQIQFPLQGNRFTLLGRAMLLFEILPKEINGSYNIDDKLKTYFDISVLEFIATGLVLWIKCDGSINYNLEIEKGIDRYVNDDTQKTFLKLSAGTPEEYRRMIRGENWKVPNKLKDIYLLEPFLQMPAISVQATKKLKKGDYVVPQPKYLLDRAGTGIFHLLSNKEQQTGSMAKNHKINPFRVYFGEVFRSYVRAQINQATKDVLVIDLDNDFKNQPGEKLPDFAIIEGNICVLIEVKTSLLTVQSRTMFLEDKMGEEIKTGSFKKAILQLHEFRNRILQDKVQDSRFDSINEVINILVGYEDIYVLNSYLLPMLEEHYGEMAKNLQLACISDVDGIGTILSEGKAFTELMKLKVSDEEQKSWMLDQFLKEYIEKKNPLIEFGFNSLLEKIGMP